MTEFSQQNNEPSNEAGLVPGSVEEAFVVDGVRRTLGTTWNPGDPEWAEAREAHRLLLEAGLTRPAVNLDNIRAIGSPALGEHEPESE